MTKRLGACLIVMMLALASGSVAAQAITRHVPHHPATLVASCPPAHQRMIVQRISAAIDIGAPAYNDGDYAGCYRAYEAAARDIERSLPNACAGASRALREGRARATSAPDAAASAWAMRDAFDGLLLVLVGSY